LVNNGAIIAARKPTNMIRTTILAFLVIIMTCYLSFSIKLLIDMTIMPDLVSIRGLACECPINIYIY